MNDTTDKRIAQNLSEFYRHLAKHIASESTSAYIHLKEYPYEDIVYLNEFSEAAIHRIEKDRSFRTLCPTVVFHNQNPSLAATLKNRGFIPLTRWKGMAIKKHPFGDIPEEINIVRISDEHQYMEWERIAHRVFHSFESSPLPLPYRHFYTHPDSPFFLGYSDGKPACIGALYEQHSTSGIYFIGTDPEFRGGGLAKAMTLKLIREARFQDIVLQASSDGYPMYQRLGFTEFCTFDLYRFLSDET